MFGAGGEPDQITSVRRDGAVGGGVVLEEPYLAVFSSDSARLTADQATEFAAEIMAGVEKLREITRRS